MRLIPVLLAAGVIAGLGGSALAETDGWYGGAEVGANFAPSIRFNALANNSWRQSHEPGYALFGQAGYGFGQIRLEGEVGWRQNDLSHFNNAAGTLPIDGGIGGISAMANLFYDINTGSKLTPYLGIGGGGLNLAADKIAAAGRPVSNGSDFIFAYQAIAGLSYALTDSLSIRGDYRYLRSEKGSLSLDPAYGPGNGTGTYAAHTVSVGFTVKFPPPAAPVVAAAPPPPPPPAPAPAPAPKPVQAAPIPKTFMVFFDFDKDVLTPEAKAIITQAAEACKKNHSATIALTGHTDLSGSVPYNQKLSVRRGEAVKKMLVQLGIPANEIGVVGKGKSDPLVPTKDGVKEPQNRRVQIVLQ